MSRGGILSCTTRLWLFFLPGVLLLVHAAVAANYDIHGNFSVEFEDKCPDDSTTMNCCTGSCSLITFCANSGIKTTVTKSLVEDLCKLDASTTSKVTCTVRMSGSDKFGEWVYQMTVAGDKNAAVMATLKDSGVKDQFQAALNAELAGSASCDCSSVAKTYRVKVKEMPNPTQAIVVVPEEKKEEDGMPVTMIALVAALVSVVLVGTVVALAFYTWKKASDRMRAQSNRKTKEPGIVDIKEKNLNELTFRGKVVDNLAHLTWEEMKERETQEAGELSKIEELVYHFFPPTLLHLIEQRGLRASALGQGGGGLSVSTSGPSAFGWEKNGDGDFRETVGKALWGEKFKDVMKGGSAADKIDAIAFVKIPKQWQCTGVPGRTDIRIVPKELLMVGHGGDFYLTPDRLKKVYFLFNKDEEEKRYLKQNPAAKKKGLEAAGHDNQALLAPIQVGKGTSTLNRE